MKVLLFTHKSDIDGMGNVVLAKLAFDEVEYILCETFNLQEKIAKYYNNGKIYDYDLIFVTDLWLEEPMLTNVAKDKRLENKFYVFDHHKSAIFGKFDKYPFTTIRISDDKGLCCGTSLFYEYLIKEGYIDKSTPPISEFSELTRKYDTWEWKTKYNDEMPHNLTLLFDSVGCECYIDLMYQKLKSNKTTHFQFSELENMLINNKINQVEEKISNYTKKIHYKEIMGLKAGIIFIDYEYRNDLAEYFRSHQYDIDFVMLIALDNGIISYRSIKTDVNVRLIAEKFGGKGHDKASSSPLSDIQKEQIIRILTETLN